LAGQGLRSDFCQREQQSFRKTVLHLCIDRIRQVLLDGMHERVDHSVGNLPGRQRIGRRRIEHRKERIGRVAREEQLVAVRTVANDAAIVHFRTGRRQCQHAAERHRIAHGGLLGQNVPRFAIEFQCGCDELGAVNDRAATDSQQKVDVPLARDSNRLHQGFVGGIGFDTFEYERGSLAERRLYLREHAVALDAAAATSDQHTRFARHLGIERSDLAFAENDAGGVMKRKVLH
jgi:hypothetical protein